MLFRRGSESQLVLHCSSRTTTFESVTLFLSTPNSDFSVISHEKKTKKKSIFSKFFNFFLKKLKKIIKNQRFHDFWTYFCAVSMLSLQLFNCFYWWKSWCISYLKFNSNFHEKISFDCTFPAPTATPSLSSLIREIKFLYRTSKWPQKT